MVYGPKCKTTKSPEDNIGENLDDSSLVMIFLVQH
jgi:hypothetical protein